jgi:SWIM/SEC-C metal-binding protein
MAKLGSEKRPLVLRFQDEDRAREAAEICAEHGWHYIIGLEPGKPEDASDLERMLKGDRRALKKAPQALPSPPKPNDFCPCQSGKVFRKCCGRQAMSS